MCRTEQTSIDGTATPIYARRIRRRTGPPPEDDLWSTLRSVLHGLNSPNPTNRIAVKPIYPAGVVVPLAGTTGTTIQVLLGNQDDVARTIRDASIQTDYAP